MGNGIGSGVGVFIRGNSIIGILTLFIYPAGGQEEWSRADSVAGREEAVTYICWKRVTFGHFCGLHCPVTKPKQFSNEFSVLYLKENHPRIGRVPYLTSGDHST